MKRYLLASLVFAVTLFSCTKGDHPSTPVNHQDTLVFAPVTTRISDLPDSLKPRTIELSKMPEPFKIILPEPGSKPGSFTTPDGQVVEVKPLEMKLLPAFEGREDYIRNLKENNAFDTGKGGLPYYTAYTTDDGLAMNYVTCAAVDKSGHIWFGTWRQGISRFDGQHFTNFSEANGLQADLISSVLEDKAGNIWISTMGKGISRYDGIKFTSYGGNSSADRRIKNITEGQSGKIWINSEAGIKYYDPESDSIYNISNTHPELSKYTFNCLKADQAGNIWLGTTKGAICFNPEKNQITDKLTETTGLASNYIFCIHEDKSGKIWFGTTNGISCHDPANKGKPVNYNTHHGLLNNYVKDIVEDSKGKLWFGTYGATISCFKMDGTEARFNSFHLPFDYLTSLTVDSSDKLWIGSRNFGAICLDPPVSGGSGSFITYSEDQGLPSNYATTVYEDSKGYLWMGSSDIVRFDGTHFTYFGAGNLYNNYFFEDHTGRIWTGGQHPGLYCADPLPGDTGIGLTIFSEEQGFSGNFVASLVDRSGTIWLSSWEKGVYRFDGESLTLYTQKHGLASNMIRTLAEDPFGNIWMGTPGGGLSCFSPSDGGIFKNFSVRQGLVHFYVHRIITDSQGNLWIATAMGLNFLGVNELKMINDSMSVVSGQEMKIRNLFKTFTTDNGLQVNRITNIAELRRGKLALSSGNGLAILGYPVDSMETFQSITDIEVYSVETGYPVRTVIGETNSLFVDREGILWIAARSEKAPLIRFDYDALHRNDTLPSLTIRQIKINEEAISFQTLANDSTQNNPGSIHSIPSYITDEMVTYGKSLSETERSNLRQKYGRLKFDGIRKFYPIPENLVIPHKHNRVTIGFGTSELIRPQLMEYQYMLEGYEKEWSPVVKNTEASFGNINEGTYTFKVKARYTGPGINEANDWTEPVSYTFSVLPPWYRSWLAYIIYAVIFVSVMWRAYLVHKEKILREEREKAQKRELEHAREIEVAYQNLEVAHENLKSTQTQLIHSEKMASLGSLTAGIAHEIQNPINFVNNFSEVNKELLEELKEEADKGNLEEVKSIVTDVIGNEQKINQYGKRAESIVKGMLLHSRGSSGQKEPTNINTLCNEYLRLSYHGFRAKDKSFTAEYLTEFDPHLPKITVVPQDIGRVLLNLVNNAFYAVDQQNKNLSGDGFKPTVVVSTKRTDNRVEIFVRDNGPGIPENIKGKIFQPFFTTKPSGQGTGLGLSLSYDIVKVHGGEISVESKEGEGSAFRIQLPCS